MQGSGSKEVKPIIWNWTISLGEELVLPPPRTWCMVELYNGAYRLAWFCGMWFHDAPRALIFGGLHVARWRPWSPSP
jgi:hypothetical protein